MYPNLKTKTGQIAYQCLNALLICLCVSFLVIGSFLTVGALIEGGWELLVPLFLLVVVLPILLLAVGILSGIKQIVCMVTDRGRAPRLAAALLLLHLVSIACASLALIVFALGMDSLFLYIFSASLSFAALLAVPILRKRYAKKHPDEKRTPFAVNLFKKPVCICLMVLLILLPAVIPYRITDRRITAIAYSLIGRVEYGEVVEWKLVLFP